MNWTVFERVGGTPAPIMNLDTGLEIFSRAYIETVVGAVEDVDVVHRSSDSEVQRLGTCESTGTGAPRQARGTIRLETVLFGWPAMSEQDSYPASRMVGRGEFNWKCNRFILRYFLSSKIPYYPQSYPHMYVVTGCYC